MKKWTKDNPARVYTRSCVRASETVNKDAPFFECAHLAMNKVLQFGLHSSKYVSIFELFAVLSLCSSSVKFRALGQNQTSLLFFSVLSELQSCHLFQFLYVFFLYFSCVKILWLFDDSRFLAVPLRRSLRFGSSIVSVSVRVVGTTSFNKRLMSNATTPFSINNNTKGNEMMKVAAATDHNCHQMVGSKVVIDC